MKEPSPSFQWFPRDFLSDINVLAMPMAARGAYITLISVCWIETSIPADSDLQRSICGMTEDEWEGVQAWLKPCFAKHPSDPSLLVHPRLEKERLGQEGRRKALAKAGAKGGRARSKGRQARLKPGLSESEASLSRTSASASASGTEGTILPSQSTSTSTPGGAPRGARESCAENSPDGPDGLQLAIRDAAADLGAQVARLGGLFERAAKDWTVRGQTPDDVRLLAAEARRQGQDPAGLFVWWLKRPEQAVQVLLAARSHRDRRMPWVGVQGLPRVGMSVDEAIGQNGEHHGE